MRKLIMAVMGIAVTLSLILGGSVTTASAAAPRSCKTLTGNWWATIMDVGTSWYHFVIIDQVTDEGKAMYICVWVVMDRKPPGKHKIQLDIAKSGPNIHEKTTKAWRLVNAKPFKLSGGQKFKATARVTVPAPHEEDNKQTIKRILTVKLTPDGELVI